MAGAPECSVVMPAYNAERYIAAAIDSVLGQTLRDIELIVVDDRSADGTARIAAGKAAADGRVRLVCAPQNGGAAAARNRGVSEAVSNWVAFIDADDLWLPDKLEKQFARQRGTGAELIYAAAECIDAGGAATGRVFCVPESADYDALLRGNVIVCSSVLVKRALLEAHPMRRSDMHEDYIEWLTLLKNGCRAAGVCEPLVRYRITAASKSGNKLRSAKMTWNVYKYIGLPFGRRCRCFWGYIRHGVRRYLG